MQRRTKVILLPAAVAVGFLGLARLLVSTVTLDPGANLLLARLESIVAGMMGASLAWYFGALRAERLVAGVAPLTVTALAGVILVAGPGTGLTVSLWLRHVLAPEFFWLLVGTLPCLAPRQRNLEHKAA